MPRRSPSYTAAAPRPRLRRFRRWLGRADLLVSVFLAVVLFGMVNLLSWRHWVRLHSRAGAGGRLSEKTLRLLEDTPGEIRFQVLMRPDNDAFRPTADLLREYEASSAAVSVRFIHPDRDLADAEALVRNSRGAAGECVVVETGGRQATLPADTLFDAPPSGGGAAAAPSPSPRAYCGEQRLSGAIRSLVRTTRPAVYFLQGHGEHSPSDFGRDGYSRIAERLRDENADVLTLDFGTARTIPADCELLVLAGPVRTLAPHELNLLRAYLDRRGRLLLLLDPRTDTGLEPLLRDWGVQTGSDVIADETHTLGGRDLHANAYPPHPATASLQGLTTVFTLSRSLRPIPQPPGVDKPAVFPVVLSSPDSWAEFDPGDASPRFDAQIDIPGPLPVAVAVERGPVPGVHVQIRPTRMMVFGDSGFASNAGLVGANGDLFLNAVHWLLDADPAQLVPGPRAPSDARVIATRPQLDRLFVCLVCVFPALLAAAGFFVSWRRRR
ncbi:MAG: Gldg family protein [Kiritimatiellae bacterium]|nr:Gldg family protein [Kiritimatiellia bacterium]